MKHEEESQSPGFHNGIVDINSPDMNLLRLNDGCDITVSADYFMHVYASYSILRSCRRRLTNIYLCNKYTGSIKCNVHIRFINPLSWFHSILEAYIVTLRNMLWYTWAFKPENPYLWNVLSGFNKRLKTMVLKWRSRSFHISRCDLTIFDYL